MLQPTIEILSIIINSVIGQISIIEFNLFPMACLLMDKPNNEWIVDPHTNNVAFAMYVFVHCLFIF
jgi:hypothetical protein